MRLLLPEARDVGGPDLYDLYDDPLGGTGAYVRGGMVGSVDGGISVDGVSKGLQTPGDLDVFRALRAVADVVLVGAGTARAEGYGAATLPDAALTWRTAHGRPASLPLAIVSAHLTLDPEADFFPTREGAARTLVITSAAAPRGNIARLGAVADVIVAGEDSVDLPAALAALAARGLTRVLCEGGPGLLGDLARAGVLTELCSTMSPMLVGAGPTMVAGQVLPPLRLELAHLLHDGAGLLARWRITGTG